MELLGLDALAERLQVGAMLLVVVAIEEPEVLWPQSLPTAEPRQHLGNNTAARMRNEVQPGPLR